MKPTCYRGDWEGKNNLVHVKDSAKQELDVPEITEEGGKGRADKPEG